MMNNEHAVRRMIAEEVRRVLKEDYARGITDFALSDVAQKASSGLLQHIKKHIPLVAPDPVKQREMLASANIVLQELEAEMKELMEDKLLKFMRMS